LEAPLRRIRQVKNSAHENFVSQYYSSNLVIFLRSVLEEIPRLIFGLLGQISEQKAARPDDRLASTIPLDEFQNYSSSSIAARDQVTVLTQRIALLVRGIRETDITVLGVIRVEPRAVLTDGLRRELARQTEVLFSGLSFPAGGKMPTRKEFVAPLSKLAASSNTCRRSFEYVQDYLGVSALQMWHSELRRVVRSQLRLEVRALCRRKTKPGVYPHLYADLGVHSSVGVTGGLLGKTFISRTAAVLLTLSDPKTTTGGLLSEWRADQDTPLDGLCFEVLFQAVGVPGLSAISHYLGILVASRMKQLIDSLTADITGQTRSALQGAEVQARSFGPSSNTAQVLRNAAVRTDKVCGSLIDSLVSIGQCQLLLRRLARSLQLAARLEAPIMWESMGALMGADLASELLEAGDQGLPSVFNFLDEGLTQDEKHEQFSVCLKRASELCGNRNPVRQVYFIVPEGSLSPEVSVLLAVSVVATASGTYKGLGGKLKKKRVEDEDIADVGAPLIAGVATLLQQLPHSRLDTFLNVVGLYVGGLFAEAAESREGWGNSEKVMEGARLTIFVGNLLSLLGLPTELLADFVPQGVLDLWPPE